MQLYGGRQLATTCFGHSGGHHQVVHSLREKLSTICKNKPKKQKKNKKPKTKQKSFLFGFFVFGYLVFLFVVAYFTQLLSQAMYSLMMATTMAETCSCQLPSTVQLHNNNNLVVFDYFIHSLYICTCVICWFFLLLR